MDIHCCTNLTKFLWSNEKLGFKNREIFMNTVEFIFKSRKFLFLIQGVGKEYNRKLHKVIAGKPAIVSVVLFCGWV